METRRVYKSGGSTLVMSIPKKWANRAQIKEGDSVFVREIEGTLNISASDKDKEIAQSIIDTERLQNPEDLKHLIISHYLAGYDDIIIKFSQGARLKYKTLVREVIRFLIGLEIAEEYEDRVLLDVVLDQEKIPTLQALKRMQLIIKSMLNDAVESIDKNDVPLAKDIISREGEVDRLYFLIVRQLKSAVRYQESAQRLGLGEQREALGFRIVVKSFERIGDHIEKMVESFLELERGSVEFGKIEKMLKNVIELFETSSNSIFKADQSLASGTFEQLKDVKKQYNQAFNQIFNKELSRQDAIHYKGMLDSLSRIADYSTDIAEIAINVSVKVP